MMRSCTAPIVLVLLLLCSACAQDRGARRNKVEAKQIIGISFLNEGRPEAALKELLEVEKLSPENAEVQNGIGLAFRDLGDPDRAVLHFEKALKINSNYPEAQNNLGTVYLLWKRWDKAVACFRQAAENVLYSTPYMAYNNMGYAFYQMGDYERALESYQKAIERFPGFSPAYDNQGLTYEMLQKWEEAVGCYEKAIRYAPDEPLYKLHLGMLFLKLKMNREAAEQLIGTIKNDPEGVYGEEAKRLLKEVDLGPGGPGE